MSDSDFDMLQKLLNRYHEESEKCRVAGAPLAGSIMQAALMEAGLLSMAYCCDAETRATKTFREAKEADLRKWSLKQLLDLANELNWLPSNLPLGVTAYRSGVDPDQALRQGDVVYYADVVREIRDMIHPGRHIRLWSGVKITKKYLESVEETVATVYDYLYDKLIALIESGPEFQKFKQTGRDSA
jgi:hypothetical protein